MTNTAANHPANILILIIENKNIEGALKATLNVIFVVC